MVTKQFKLSVERQLDHILAGKETCSECCNCSCEDCKKSFEEAKEIAFRFWDVICKEAPCPIRIEHDYNDEIRFFCKDSYISELEAFSDCSQFTKILATIADHSNLAGKCYLRHRYPLRIVEFSF